MAKELEARLGRVSEVLDSLTQALADVPSGAKLDPAQSAKLQQGVLQVSRNMLERVDRGLVDSALEDGGDETNTTVTTVTTVTVTTITVVETA